MKLVNQVLVTAAAHCALSVVSLLGATLEAANAIRAGADQAGPLGTFFHVSAVVLCKPASIGLWYMPRDTVWVWPILALNSMLWAVVLVGIFRRFWRKGQYANT